MIRIHLQFRKEACGHQAKTNVISMYNFKHFLTKYLVLTNIGFTTARAVTINPGKYQISAQWDTNLYLCNISFDMIQRPLQINTTYNCTIEVTPLSCPGIESSFWISIYSQSWEITEILGVTSIHIQDETGNVYWMRQFCAKPHPLLNSAPPFCKTPAFSGYVDIAEPGGYDRIYVGGLNAPFPNTSANLIAFITPEDIYNHPNDLNNTSEMAVLNGMYL